MFNKKKTLLAVSVSAMIWYLPLNTFAGMPATDYAFLGNVIIEKIESFARHQGKKVLMNNVMEQLSALTGLSIENENNLWANNIVRTNNHEQGLQNMEIKQDFEPGVNSCEMVTASKLLNGELCDLSAEILGMEDNANDGININVPDELSHLSADKRSTLKKIGILNRAKEKRPDLLDDDITQEEKAEIANMIDKTNFIVTNPIMMVSSSSYMLTLTEEEKNTLMDFATLVSPTPTMSATEQSIYELDGGLKLNFAIKQAFSSIPLNTFHQLISKRTPLIDVDGAPSTLEVLQRFSDENYSTDDVKNSVLYKAATSSLVSPESLTRNNLVLTAYRAHLKTEMYKQSLNTELLYAAMLSKKINK